MLKLDIDTHDPKKVVCDIETDGDIPCLMTDLFYGLGTLYDRLKKADADAAAEFRHYLTHAANDPNSPLWTISPPPSETDVVIVTPGRKG